MNSKTPGEEPITFSNQPLRAVKIPGDVTSLTQTQPQGGSVLGEVHDEPKHIPPSPENLSAKHMRVLVAEDDPINSKIIKKRLEKLGHEVYLTVNGEECASAFGDRPKDFDVVLMDMQVSCAVSTVHQNKLTARTDANRRRSHFDKNDKILRENTQEYLLTPSRILWTSSDHRRVCLPDRTRPATLY